MLGLSELLFFTFIALNCIHWSICDDKVDRKYCNFKWPKIYIYGDSITQGSFSEDGDWAAILSNELTRNADIIARGFAGYNSRQCKALLPYLENDFNDVSIAGIFLGANDANDPTTDANQAVPVAEYKENLKYMISYMQKFDNIKSVFLITPPAFNEDKWIETFNSEGIHKGKTTELVNPYIDACIETGKEVGVPFIDVRSAMMQRNDWKDLLKDGLHFNPKGSEFFAYLLLPRLKAMLSENNIGTEEELFPSWSDISNEDPNASIIEWFEKSGVKV